MRRMLLLALALMLAACRAPLTPQPTPVPAPTAAPALLPTPEPAHMPAPTVAPAPTSAARPAGEAGATLRVYADEALRASFAELAEAFGNLTPGLQVNLVFAPSAELVARLRAGERGDVVALAGDAPLNEAISAGLIAEARAVPFAEDRLALVLPGQSDAEGLAALARPHLRLALARQGTAPGDAARAALARLAAAPPEAWTGISPAPTLDSLLRAARIYDDQTAIVEALRAGDADATIIYESAVTPRLEDELRPIPIPAEADQRLRYRIAPLAGAARPDDADQFVALVAEAPGQATLAAYHFYPAIDSTIRPALEIGGAVDRPLALTVEQLAQAAQLEVEVRDRGGATSRFTGVSLRTLLERAEPRSEARSLLLQGGDGTIREVPIAFVRSCADCIIATLEDGSLRAILPDYDQAAWVGMLAKIEVQ